MPSCLSLVGNQDKRLNKLWSVSCVVAALCAFGSVGYSRVSAQAVLSAQGGFAVPVNADYASNGGDITARLGRRIPIRSFWETPELVFNYATFASSTTNAGYPPGFEVIRGMFGVRLTFGGILRPGIYGHLGLGRLNGAIGPTIQEVRRISHTAFTWDGGVTLDLALSRNFELGVHGAYSHLLGPGTRVDFRWLEFGGHLALIF